MSEEKDNSGDRSSTRPKLEGLDLRQLMAEGLAPDTGDDTPPEIDGYEVLRPIGAGGMGKVYLARQISLDRLVAIKVLPVAAGIATQFLDRLEREAMAMAKISHPNIVGVYDFVRLDDSGAAIIMEWIDGGNLREIYLSDKKPVKELNRVVSVIRQIADSLAAAHRVGIVHRDVKPENILISQEGVVKVSDFGLALPMDEEAHRITVSGTSLGTLGYMAPEQMDGSPVDARADIFSLGVIFYEMLTGVRPQGNFDPPRALRPGLPQALNDLTLLTLRTNPVQRIQSAEDLVAALSRKGGGGRRAFLAAAAVGGVAAAAGGAYYVYDQNKAKTGVYGAAVSAFEFTNLKDTMSEENGGFLSSDKICILQLHTELPAQGFDLKIDFTRWGGSHSIGAFMKLPEGTGSVELSAWGEDLGGLQTLTDENGTPRDLRDGSVDAFRMALENNKPYELLIQYRPGFVTTYVNGQEMQNVSIGDRTLGIAEPWGWDQLDTGGVNLALATYQTPTFFQSVELTPVK